LNSTVDFVEKAVSLTQAPAIPLGIDKGTPVPKSTEQWRFENKEVCVRSIFGSFAGAE